MKTKVYAVRNEHGIRLTYRYRDIEDARKEKREIEARHNTPNLEVYMTTQDLPGWR